jgi:hypothetical protein
MLEEKKEVAIEMATFASTFSPRAMEEEEATAEMATLVVPCFAPPPMMVTPTAATCNLRPS